MPFIHKSDSGPAQFLADNIALLPRGRTLDIAMGVGRNAVYLAGIGFSVEGVDISPQRVADARRRAQQAGVTINAHVADLEDEYRIKKGVYDLIICFNYLQRPLIPQIRDGLKKGGIVVYETYIVDQAQWGKPRNPDHLLRHNELLDLFCDFRCLRYREGVVATRRAVASIVAQKV